MANERASHAPFGIGAVGRVQSVGWRQLPAFRD